MNERLYLVCGSRHWPAPWFVTAKIIELIPIGATILTGGATRRGGSTRTACSVDQHAAEQAKRLGYESLVMPADWEAEPRRAGIIRNLAMLDLQPAAVLAFQFARSRGTAHTILNAHKRGITLHHFTEADLRPDLVALDMGDIE